jgi:hypothetical protein
LSWWRAVEVRKPAPVSRSIARIRVPPDTRARRIPVSLHTGIRFDSCRKSSGTSGINQLRVAELGAAIAVLRGGK